MSSSYDGPVGVNPTSMLGIERATIPALNSGTNIDSFFKQCVEAAPPLVQSFLAHLQDKNTPEASDAGDMLYNAKQAAEAVASPQRATLPTRTNRGLRGCGQHPRSTGGTDTGHDGSNSSCQHGQNETIERNGETLRSIWACNSLSQRRNPTSTCRNQIQIRDDGLHVPTSSLRSHRQMRH